MTAYAALPHAEPNNISGSHIVSLIRAIPRHNIENSSVPCAVVAHSRPRGCDATRFQIFVERANSRFLTTPFFSQRSLRHTCAFAYTYVCSLGYFNRMFQKDWTGYMFFSRVKKKILMKHVPKMLR